MDEPTRCFLGVRWPRAASGVSGASKGLLALCASALAVGCGYEAVGGAAMGTTFAVQADCRHGVPRQRIVAVLDEVDGQMSTYDPDSELSKFNRAPVGVAVPVSHALAEVASAAQRVAEESGGAFDATSGPLTALWGFGAQAATDAPDEARLRAAQAEVGFARLEVSSRPPVLRKRAAATLDLSAVAKGFAVDRIAGVLAASSCDAYLVELGGEVRSFGAAPGGGPWRIGIDAPGAATASGELGPALVVRDAAVATSGDYRQSRAPSAAERRLLPSRQERISHVVDPRSGLPVAHAAAAVTVLAESAMLADAYATALLVLGAERGIDFAERRGLAALFVERGRDGFELRCSTAMRPHLDLGAWRSRSNGCATSARGESRPRVRESRAFRGGDAA